MAIRLAMGATRRDLLRIILWQGLRLVAVGLVVGVIAALFVARAMTAILFEVGPYDPLTYGAVLLLIVTVTLMASLLPALRAARGDPVVALRHE
jgi:ABC-type lipoprotein release transport system permease subunit